METFLQFIKGATVVSLWVFAITATLIILYVFILTCILLIQKAYWIYLFHYSKCDIYIYMTKDIIPRKKNRKEWEKYLLKD